MKSHASNRRIKDAHLMDMLMLSRECSESNHFLVKGLNLAFRECPYLTMINLTDLEGRLDNVLSSKDLVSLNSILIAISGDMYGSVLFLNSFFGDELLCRKIPIVSKICKVLKDHQGMQLLHPLSRENVQTNEK